MSQAVGEGMGAKRALREIKENRSALKKSCQNLLF